MPGRGVAANPPHRPRQLGPRVQHFLHLPQPPRFARHDRRPDQPGGAKVDLGPLVEQLLDLQRHGGRSRRGCSLITAGGMSKCARRI